MDSGSGSKFYNHKVGWKVKYTNLSGDVFCNSIGLEIDRSESSDVMQVGVRSGRTQELAGGFHWRFEPLQSVSLYSQVRTLPELDGCGYLVKQKGALGPLSPRVLDSTTEDSRNWRP
ncbi:hypothetical protein Tco_1314428 [Tanacetum coccineum]